MNARLIAVATILMMTGCATLKKPPPEITLDQIVHAEPLTTDQEIDAARYKGAKPDAA